MAGSAVIGALRVNLSLDSAAFTKGLNNAQGALKKAGQNMRNVGRNMSTYVSAPLAGFGALIAKTAGDFEQGMNRVQAVSGATGDQLAQLRAQAKELGRTTQFSATQAADAMGFLAQAGFKADQILGAMPGTLQLAASANLDLGTTADIVSNILQGYGKDVSELGHVNDVLVKAFTASNTNLEQLGEAMKYAGPVASAAGVQFETAAAALGLMGNAGIQASMAGTSLRGAISRILNPTANVRGAMEEAGLSFTDAAGKLLPLDQIIQQLEPHAEDAGLFMKLFGQRAGPAMAALVGQGSGALRDLTTELENSGGTAQKIADVQMEGFNGQMRALRSAFEGLTIAIADSGLLEFLTQAATKLTGWMQSMAESSPQVLKWGTVIAGIAAAAGPVVFVLGSMATAISALLPIIAAFSTAIMTLIAASGPLGLLAIAVAGIVTAWQNWDTIGPILENLYSACKTWLQDKLGSVLNWVKGKVDSVTGVFRDMYDAVVGHSFVPDMVNEIGQWMGRLGDNMVKPAVDAADATSSAFEGVGEGISNVFSGFGSSIAGAIKGTREWSDVLSELLGKLADNAFQSAMTGLFGGTGGGGVGGFFSGLLGGLFGFANGGSFTVPDGGGIDSQLVAFKATPGETVDVRKPGQDMGGGAQEITVRGVFVDDNGVIKARVDSMGRQAAQAGAALGARNVSNNMENLISDTQMRKL